MQPNTEPAMVIVGAGHVGGRAALALREAGWTGEIVLIGSESALPYERPPLSKGVLTGAQTLAQTAILTPEACDAARITHWTGTVTAIHPMARSVSLSDGRSLSYKSLLLATGGHARVLAIPGADHAAVQALRTQADAIALAPRLKAGAHVVLVGGGFIGLEVAASARAMGCRVTLLEGAPRLMGRAVPASVADRVLALHRRHGVDVRLGIVPRAFEATDGVALRIHLTDGEPLLADVVVVGIGIEPATELARGAGLRIERGIVVDRRLATSAAGVYAAGDVAEFPSPLSGLPIRQETWHNAETQARVAALNMLGGDESYRSSAWFWSDQYDWQLQVSGEPALGVTAVQRPLGDVDAELNLYLNADGRIVGVSGCGPTSVVAKELKLARTLVERGVHASAEQLADPAVKLKSLLTA
ncbi:NAD(P)/FAD-dependent oxidoreductase [Sphaerotilus mobilis]|uniref:3-phenylpropionate/trans-cinnamate dioxygenase ferredoxin reductase subunit n=1 Tax=Sphaerotilus mobilis TaxID=47994 RepID=A0A4Q7LFH0_9BURK|nr:FAD-dependent oxidoreductase [Sphaerotilus mobilis]RZS52904.1 3-phenylpropionate/trans-cinnamate dioxygenase ferredoxin reductase subunit [Sphaerotilus mobilis]